jgi:hypothetical protein
MSSNRPTGESVDIALSKKADRLAIKMYDIVGSQEALTDINMREFSLFASELEAKFRGKVQDGADIAEVVASYFQPEVPGWWAHHIKQVVAVKAKLGGGGVVKLKISISKTAIERIVENAMQELASFSGQSLAPRGGSDDAGDEYTDADESSSQEAKSSNKSGSNKSVVNVVRSVKQNNESKKTGKSSKTKAAAPKPAAAAGAANDTAPAVYGGDDFEDGGGRAAEQKTTPDGDEDYDQSFDAN